MSRRRGRLYQDTGTEAKTCTGTEAKICTIYLIQAVAITPSNTKDALALIFWNTIMN